MKVIKGMEVSSFPPLEIIALFALLPFFKNISSTFSHQKKGSLMFMTSRNYCNTIIIYDKPVLWQINIFHTDGFEN